MKRIALTVLLSLFAALSNLSVTAGEPPSETPSHALANLDLRLNSPGEAEIGFSVIPLPRKGVGPIWGALTRSLGCDALRASSIDSGEDGWYLKAQCVGVTPRRGFMAAGALDPAALLQQVHLMGVEVLVVSIFHARDVPFRSWGGAGYAVKSTSAHVQVFRIPTNVSLPPIIHLQLGYSRRDVAQMFIPLLVLLFAPTVLTLCVRRAVLRKPDARSSGAWFGYSHFLRWNAIGAFIFWVTAVQALKVHPFLEFVLGTNLHGKSASLETACSFVPDFLPPILVNILCTVLSYRVFVELQEAEWTRREVFQQAVWSQMATFVPIAMMLGGLRMITLSSPRFGGVTMLSAFFLMIFSAHRLQKVTNREPYALMTGELRDRAFALAEKAGTKLKQLFVLSTRKAPMANAYARAGNSIVLTDYLVGHLSKREVDATLAHEIAHIKRRHPNLLGLILIVAVAIAVFSAGTLDVIVRSLPEGSMLPVCILLGLALYFAVARGFERRADTDALQLTNDPEALIRALAKVKSLNRLPMRWGKVRGALLTHPPFMHRIRSLACRAGISEQHLSQILSSPEESADCYPIPPSATPGGKAFCTSFKTNLSLRVAWSLIAASTLTPALVAFVATRMQLPVPLWSVLAFGFVCTLLLVSWITNVGPVWGGLILKRKILERMRSQGFAVDTWGGIFVGFAPDPFPRLYEANSFWDVGFLIPVGDRLCYLGEETQFFLRRNQIANIRLGPGHVSWWPTQRVYITWRDEEKRTSGTFNVVPADPPSVTKLYVATAALAEMLQAWLRGSSLSPGLPIELEGLGSPAIGAVTCLSPGQLGTARGYLTNSLFWALMALLVASLFGFWETPRKWGLVYTMCVALLVAIGLRLPYSLYRDRPA